MDNITAEDHFHIESLEDFTAALTASGFEPVVVAGLPAWRGPIHPAFVSLTEAQTMDIVIQRGWPFQPPALLVDGLDTNHSTLGGFVCLWRDGDPSLEWTTVEGFRTRIEQWCENAKSGWEGDDLGHDALLNFRKWYRNVATFDLSKLKIARGSWGDMHGVVSGSPLKVEVLPGRQPSTRELQGLWFHAGLLETPPPRELTELSRCLSRSHRKGLERAVANRRTPEPFSVSGGVDLILFCWERDSRPNLLVMGLEGTKTEVEAIALQPGPTDEDSLILRAGPDAPRLRDRNATIFGAGALGGYTAAALSESGIGSLNIVDGDTLLPGNVVRHVAGHDQVGRLKVQAVHQVIGNHAPWTKVVELNDSPMARGRLREYISDSDIVINTTGNGALSDALAMTTKEMGVPLVSGALLRGGCVARIRRQVLPGDTPIHQRDDEARYPVIPAGAEDDDFASPALGCSAPVNNAPPAAVMACAAFIVQVAVDAMTSRFEFDDEVIHVLRAIPEPPFDRVGQVRTTYP